MKISEIFDIPKLLSECNIDFKILKTNKGTDEYNFDCPFCDKKGLKKEHDKFFLNTKTGLGFCYRSKCGWNGNFIKFLGDIKGIPYEDVIEFFGKEKNKILINFDMLNESSTLDTDIKMIIPEIYFPECSFSVDSYPSKFPKYISDRGLSYDMALKMRCNICFECELKHIIPGCYKGGDPRYEYRLLVPVKTTGLRTFQALTFKGRQPKAENPPNSKKQLFIFNYDELLYKTPLNYVIVVEGIFDAVNIWNLGYKNTVAILGNKISEYQSYLLSILDTKEIIVMLDSDVPVPDVIKSVNRIGNYYKGELTYVLLNKGDPGDLKSKKTLDSYLEERFGFDRGLYL